MGELIKNYYLFVKKTKFGLALEIAEDPNFNKVLYQTTAESWVEAKKKIEKEYLGE